MPDPKALLDNVIEATIVGSFSKLGFAARDKLHGLDPVDADLTGQRALITGGTSGIGRAVAAGLMGLGADVVITSRSADRADQTASELEAEVEVGGSARGLALDTADYDSVRDAARAIEAGPALDMLCHNAGALTDTYSTNAQGMEMTLASHLVGPYLLTNELRDHMVPGARVIWMSSGGMYTRGLEVDRIEMPEKVYRGAIAYAQAKRGQVEMVTYLGPKWAPDVVMHAMHPGWVDTPGVEQGLPGFRKITGPILRSPEQGADTMVWLAATGAEGAEPGQFWLDRRARSTSYLPGTGTDDAERQKLIEWLDLVTLPGAVG